MSEFANDSNFAELFEQRIAEVLVSEENRRMIGDLAHKYFIKHYGCSQSMLQAFMDVMELKDDFWFQALGGLQGGGGCGHTCGALTAGFVLISAKFGRKKLEEGFQGLLPMLEPCHQLSRWFKTQYKSTVCSEISGYDWFNTLEVVSQHLTAKGQERMENCALITSGTAYKVAEILSEK